MAEITDLQMQIADGKAPPTDPAWCSNTPQEWWSDDCPDCGDALLNHKLTPAFIRPDGSVVPEGEEAAGDDLECVARVCAICQIRNAIVVLGGVL